jgi:integrase
MPKIKLTKTKVAKVEPSKTAVAKITPKIELTKIKITDTAVAKLKAPDPSGKQTIHWDAELRGFGVLCSGVTNAKTFIVQRDVKDGAKGRRLTIGDARTLPCDVARDRAADALDEMRRGIDPKAKAPEKAKEWTLQTALDAYLDARKNLRPASAAYYRATVKRYLSAWVDLPLRAISPEMVEARHREIARDIAANNKRAAATGQVTANAAVRVLRTLYSFTLERDSSLPPNPVNRLKRQWFEETKRTGHVPAADMPRFYAAVMRLPNAVARDYILTLLFTGMRRAEAASMVWSDCDFTAKTIRVPPERTKGKRALYIPMSSYVFDLLSARAALGKDRFVFPANSASGHIEEPKFALGLVEKETDLKVTAHDLRRTFASAVESAEVSFVTLKSLLNHSLAGDVTAGYIVFQIDRLREPAQRVCDLLKKQCGIEAATPTHAKRRSRQRRSA